MRTLKSAPLNLGLFLGAVAILVFQQIGFSTGLDGKIEWSVIQSIEASNRDFGDGSLEIREINGYVVVGIANQEIKRRVWVLLNPKTRPILKVLPIAAFTLERNQYDDLVSRFKIDESVKAFLMSHVDEPEKKLIIAQSESSGFKTDRNKKLSSISDALSGNEVRQIDVVYYSTNIMTRIAITPEWLEQKFEYKIIFKDEAVLTRVLGIRHIVKSLNPRKTKETPDVRWGVIFYGVDKVRLGSVYLDGTGRHGVIEGMPVEVDRGLLNWLATNCGSCFQ